MDWSYLEYMYCERCTILDSDRNDNDLRHPTNSLPAFPTARQATASSPPSQWTYPIREAQRVSLIHERLRYPEPVYRRSSAVVPDKIYRRAKRSRSLSREQLQLHRVRIKSRSAADRSLIPIIAGLFLQQTLDNICFLCRHFLTHHLRQVLHFRTSRAPSLSARGLRSVEQIQYQVAEFADAVASISGVGSCLSQSRGTLSKPCLARPSVLLLPIGLLNGLGKTIYTSSTVCVGIGRKSSLLDPRELSLKEGVFLEEAGKLGLVVQ